MLGIDEKGKPHASWFGPAHAEGVERAAELMNFGVIRVDTDDLAKIAASLPPGKLFESGKAFVPFVKRETYELLASRLDDEFLAAAAARVAAATDGQNYAEASKGEAPAHLPEDWSKLAVGDRVLASDGPGDGWYEADVREILPDGKFRLQWRDWPEIAPFSRKVTDIALLHPKHTGA
ncbi:tudor domain-containing protein [Rhizobium sp. CAU 1783]